jgi:hypothetical protein
VKNSIVFAASKSFVSSFTGAIAFATSTIEQKKKLQLLLLHLKNIISSTTRKKTFFFFVSFALPELKSF